MDYSFNSRIAQLYGVEEAVFIHNLYWWIAKNEANGRHYYEGKSWTYNSIEAYTNLFPFWTKRQIERIVRKLRDSGAIYVGNYNASAIDRTQWYALSQTVTSIYANGGTQTHETLHANTQTVTAIPDSKPYINTNSKPDREGRTAPHPPKSTAPKQPYGSNGWVKLSDGEYQSLTADLGEKELVRCIEYLDESAQSTGNKNGWKDWNLVIRRCSRDGWGKGRGAQAENEVHPQSYDLDDLGRRLLARQVQGG